MEGSAIQVVDPSTFAISSPPAVPDDEGSSFTVVLPDK